MLCLSHQDLYLLTSQRSKPPPSFDAYLLLFGFVPANDGLSPTSLLYIDCRLRQRPDPINCSISSFVSRRHTRSLCWCLSNISTREFHYWPVIPSGGAGHAFQSVYPSQPTEVRYFAVIGATRRCKQLDRLNKQVRKLIFS